MTTLVGDSGAADGRARMQTSAVRGSVWTIISSTVSLPLNLVANAIVVRLLGPDQYGLLASLLAALGIGMVILNAGVSDATVQWGAGFDARAERSSLVDLARRSAGFHVYVQTPAAVVVVAVLLRDAPATSLVIGCLGIALTMLLGTSTVVQVAINRTARNAQIVMVTNVVLQGAVVVAAIAAREATLVWSARLLVTTLPAVVILFSLPRDLRRAVLRPLAPRAFPPGFLPFAVKAASSALLTTLIYSRSEIFVLQHYGMAVAAGIFALAFGLSYQLTAAVDALLLPLLPAAAGLVSVDRDAAARGLLRALRIVSVGAALILAVLVAPVTAVFTSIYGTEFASAAVMFVPLAVVSCLGSVNGPVTAFVTALHRLGALLVVTGVAFVLDMVLALLLVPALGAWGAVLANSVGQVAAIGGAWRIVSADLAVPLRAMVVAALPLARGTVVAAAASTAAVLAQGALPAYAVAILTTALGTVLVVALNSVGPRSLGAAEVDLVVGALPRRLAPVAAASVRVLRFGPVAA